jgi:hypothetical protein
MANENTAQLGMRLQVIEWVSYCASQQNWRADVRDASKADVTLLNFDVRFTLESGHSPTRSGCLLWAMCGRLRVGKENLHVAGLVGAAMCSAFECGTHDRWP